MQIRITLDAIKEARRNPGGWVYRIEGDFGPTDAVPPEAIVGAWKVDDNGQIVGDFIPNPNFRRAPSASKSAGANEEHKHGNQ